MNVDACNPVSILFDTHYRESVIHTTTDGEHEGSSILRRAILEGQLVLSGLYEEDISMAWQYLHTYNPF